MEKSDNNSAEQDKIADTKAWVKEHEDSLDYPDVPVGNRNYKYDNSGLPPEVQKAMAERKAQMAKESGISDSALILKATQFAALKHRDQRRKDHAASPYICHPIFVANELTQAGITDPEVIAAALVKICDKIANICDVTNSPPPDWSNERRMAYLDWAASVVAGCKVDNDQLKQKFESVLADGREMLF